MKDDEEYQTFGDKIGVLEGDRIIDCLEGKDVPSFKSGKTSAVSYLKGYTRGTEFVDLLAKTNKRGELQLDGVLFFRSERNEGTVMMRVTASIGKQRLVCFKAGSNMMDLVGMFIYKLNKGEVEWRTETKKRAMDDTEGFPGSRDAM